MTHAEQQPPHVPPVQPVTDRESASVDALLTRFTAAQDISDPIARFCAGARIGHEIAASPDYVNAPRDRQ